MAAYRLHIVLQATKEGRGQLSTKLTSALWDCTAYIAAKRVKCQK